MPILKLRGVGLVVLANLVGCGPLDPSTTGNGAGLSSESSAAQSGQKQQSLPPNPKGWRLPWACGTTLGVNQGNNGDQCGVIGDHVGIQDYAWDFGLPMRTPVLASRPGTVTFAATYSPPGSECHDGCPYAW